MPCRWARLSRQGRPGRPATHRHVRSVVLRLARENELRGYGRIHGELAGLGITVAPSAVRRILKSARDQPGAPPGRPRPGRVPAIAGTGDPGAGLLHRRPPQRDEGLCPGRDRARHRPDPGLGRHGEPGPVLVVQQARNLLMDTGDAGTGMKFVLHDRDASFTAAFDAVFQVSPQVRPSEGSA
jgi:putative transposase